MFHGDDLLLLSLFLADLLLLHFLLSLHFLLLLSLDDGDPLVQLGEEVGQFRVDLVDEVAEVGAGLVVDALEEHDRGEVLLEILDFLLGQLALEDVDDFFLLGALHLLGQTNDLILQGDDAVNISAQLLDPHCVHLDDFCADEFDLVIGSSRDLIDEVPDGQLGRLGQDVLDVSGFDELHLLDHPQNAPFGITGLELALACPSCLLEEQDAFLEHEEIHEESFLLAEKEAVFVLELDHLADFLVVILDRVIGLGPIDDEAASILDILEGLEGAVQISNQLGQLIRPGLTDVALVDDQHQLHLLVDVQQSLHEERVRNLILLSLVILKSWAIVEGHVLDDHLGRN